MTTRIKLKWDENTESDIIELKWDENTESDIAGYVIRWDGDNRKVFLLQKGTHTITLDVILKRKTLYTFSVIAFDKAGNESSPKILKAWYKE